MQGKLSDIDIRSILQLIELGQRTGELFVETYLPPGHYERKREVAVSSNLPISPIAGQAWFIFFLNGQILYTSDATSNLSRLKDYLRRYQAEADLDRLMAGSSASLNLPEYDYLWLLLKNHVLTPAQCRSIIHGMVHETLFDLLSLHQGNFIFATGSALSPQLTALDVTPPLTRTMKQVQQWKQLHPYVQSPEQCLAIADVAHLQGLLPNRTFDKFSGFADGKTSIRQIARYLNRDILTVARAIYPYIQQEVIQLSQTGLKGLGAEASSRAVSWNPYSASATQRPTIVCVDDGASDREMVQSVLNSYGYEVTAIAESIEALSLIFRLHPDLILCDMTMLNLDGYEMCSMLRQSKAFRRTPIVMLTGKDGFMERVRARMAGATDFLTKPFGESELLMLVEKYIGFGNAQPPQSVKLLADRSDDRLQIDRTDASSISSTPLN